MQNCEPTLSPNAELHSTPPLVDAVCNNPPAYYLITNRLIPHESTQILEISAIYEITP